jgi:hypothetical protein
MNIQKKLRRERKSNLSKILIPLMVMFGAAYFLYSLAIENFFIKWELYFIIGCYSLIFLTLIIIDLKIIYWINYSIFTEDDKLKIKDGFLSRIIIIPIDRLYYISSSKAYDQRYDSIFITDKKVNHKKIKLLNEDEFKNTKEHAVVIKELCARYPDKTFYYYRVVHHGYKFLYYMFMLYKSCERCKFSNTSMDLVRKYAEGI